MDDPADDPREFHTHGGLGGGLADDGVPPGIDAFLRASTYVLARCRLIDNNT
jgi:hypothetical protein